MGKIFRTLARGPFSVLQGFGWFLKHELTRLGMLLVLALCLVPFYWAAQLVFVCLGYDRADRDALGEWIIHYMSVGTVAFLVGLGFVVLGRQLIIELRARRAPPVPPAAAPPVRKTVPPQLPR